MQALGRARWRATPPAPLLHVHGRGHEALAAGDVGRQRLVTGRLQVVDQDRGGAAVQGSAGLVVQALEKAAAVEKALTRSLHFGQL